MDQSGPWSLRVNRVHHWNSEAGQPLGLRCDQEDRCEQQYKDDRAVCNALPGGTPARQKVKALCWASAADRYGNCLANRPLGPLITHDAVAPEPEPQKGSNTQPGSAPAIPVGPPLDPLPELVPAMPEVPIFEPILIP